MRAIDFWLRSNLFFLIKIVSEDSDHSLTIRQLAANDELVAIDLLKNAIGTAYIYVLDFIDG